MKWIHISDIHYKNRSEWLDTTRAKEKFVEYLKGQKFDYLFITGDYGHALDNITHEEKAKESAEFIQKIATTIGVADENIILVAGNHDYMKSEADNAKKLKKIIKNYIPQNGKFNGDDDDIFLKNRFKPFSLIKEALGQNGYDEFHSYRIENDFSLLLLNTALTCNGSKGNDVQILGINSVYDCLEAIKQQNPNKPIIILAHHELSMIKKAEQEYLEDIFTDYNIVLYLCGDAHSVHSRTLNGIKQIRTGTLLSESGVDTVFVTGELNTNGLLYTAHQWDKGNWAIATNINNNLNKPIKEFKTINYPYQKMYDNVCELYTQKQTILGKDFPLSKIYIQPNVIYKEETIDALTYLKQWLSENEFGVSVLLGEPGHGKSTFCLDTVFKFNNNELNFQNSKTEIKDVLYLDLKSNVQFDIINSNIKGIKYDFDYETIIPRNCLVFLDGFDEIFINLQNENVTTSALLDKLKLESKKLNCYFVLTSRVNYVNKTTDLGRTPFAELSNLTDEQRELWINGFDYEDKMNITEYQYIKENRPDLYKLMNLPILFQLIVQFRFTENFKNRAELYENLFEKIIERQNDMYHFESMDFNPEKNKLKELSYEIFINNDEYAEINDIDFKKYKTMIYTFYLSTQQVHIEFLHRSFYQYFLALYIYDKITLIEFEENELEDFFYTLSKQRLERDMFNLLKEISSIQKKTINFQVIRDKILETDCIVPKLTQKNIRNRLDKTHNIFHNIISILSSTFDSDQKNYKCLYYLLREFKTYGIILTGANLSESDLSWADLSEADLSGANLSWAYLSGADLSLTYLSKADLSGADLSKANLLGADLSGADLSKSDLSWAYLSKANLLGADLSEAYLLEADLSWANLSGANLSKANLSKADLSGAYLSGANLSKANLSKANLSKAYLSDTILDDKQKTYLEQKGYLK